MPTIKRQLLCMLLGITMLILMPMTVQANSEQSAEQIMEEQAMEEQAMEEQAMEEQAMEEKPYSIDAEGRVDWYTFSGFRRYHAECHVCHGPAGLGSSFAPNLLDSLKELGYEKFLEVVVNGRVNVSTEAQNVMPAFGTNLNVMCFLDDIYAYLYARADDAIGSERPDKQAKPEEATERDNACLGS